MNTSSPWIQENETTLLPFTDRSFLYPTTLYQADILLKL